MLFFLRLRRLAKARAESSKLERPAGVSERGVSPSRSDRIAAEARGGLAPAWERVVPGTKGRSNPFTPSNTLKHL